MRRCDPGGDLGPIGEAKFGQDVLDVAFGGALGDDELAGELPFTLGEDSPARRPARSGARSTGTRLPPVSSPKIRRSPGYPLDRVLRCRSNGVICFWWSPVQAGTPGTRQPSSPVFGRRQDSIAVERLPAPARLVTVTGIGGSAARGPAG